MKAAELSGIHLGQVIQLRLDTATVTDVISGVSHEADIVQDSTYSGHSMTALGRKLVRIQFQRMGSIKVTPDVEVHLPIEKPRGS